MIPPLPFFLSRRLFEIIIPLTTWFTITMPLWLSPFHPAVVAYLVIAFDVYFFYKTLRSSFMATISYVNIIKSKKVNWLVRAQVLPNFNQLQHFVIITNYKETAAKVGKSLDCLARQNYPLKNIHIMLAMEENEGEAAYKRACILKEKYGHLFGTFVATYHKLLPGEEKGKASNETYAAREVSRIARERHFDPEKIMVTSSDADSLLDNQYCAYLANLYLADTDSKYHFYWAPVLLYNNYWKLHFFIRMQTTVSSFLRLAFLAEKHSLIQISTYSMSLWMLEEVGYWDTDIIPEDWHIFLQAFFKLGERVQTKPVYLITTRDGVYGKNMFESFKNRYEQEKRWAWGVSDIPYALQHFFVSRHIPLFPKLYRVLGVLETHMLWPSSFFLLTFGATIPVLINPYFQRTVLGHLLPQIAGAILTLTTSFIIVIGIIDFHAKRWLLKKPEGHKVPILIVQWILFPILSPIISAFLSSIPALESHTRLLLGRPISYKVTKKV